MKFKIEEKYYYADEFKMDPEKWARYKKSFVYETVKQMKALSLYYEKKVTTNQADWMQTEITKAVSVRNKKVKDSKFEIDNQLVILEK